MWKKQIPCCSVGLNQSPEESSQGSISNLGVAISLWMTYGVVLEFGSHFLSQSDPQVTKELSIMIQDNGPRNTMQSHDFFGVWLGNVNDIIDLVKGCEIRHLRKPVHHRKDRAFVPLSFR